MRVVETNLFAVNRQRTEKKKNEKGKNDIKAKAMLINKHANKQRNLHQHEKRRKKS